MSMRPPMPTRKSTLEGDNLFSPAQSDFSAQASLPPPGHPRRFRALLEQLAAEYQLASAHSNPEEVGLSDYGLIASPTINMGGPYLLRGNSTKDVCGTQSLGSLLPLLSGSCSSGGGGGGENLSGVAAAAEAVIGGGGGEGDKDDDDEPYEVASVRTVLERWVRFAEALLEMHPDLTFTLRDCWQKQEVNRRPTLTRPSRLGLPDLFSESMNDGGQDILEKVWRPKAPHFVTSKTRRFKPLPSTKSSPNGTFLMMHPDGSHRMLWAFLGLVFIALDMFFLTMAVFGPERPHILMLLDGIYWSSDIGVNFCIGMYKADRLEMRRTIVAKHYLRTWFLADVVVVIVQWVLVVLDVGSPGTGLVRYMRLARFLRLVRLAKFNRNLRQLLLNQVGWANLLLKMALYLASVAVWVHLSATAFYWIGDRPGGWTKQEPEFSTFPLSYLMSVHWAASQLQGSIDVHPVYSTSERSFAVLNLLASVAVLAMVVSKVTNVLHAMQLANRDRNRITTAARRFLERNDVRSELSLQIYRYLTKREVVKARMGNDDDEREMLHRLPLHLRRTLLMEARWPMVNRYILFVAFANSSDHFKQLLLCDLLQSTVYLPDDLIFQYGASCTRMYLLVYGECHYLRYGRTFVSLLATGRVPKLNSDKGKDSAGTTASMDSDCTEGGFASQSMSASRSFEAKDSEVSYAQSFSAFQARHRELQGCRVRRNTTLAEAGLWTNWSHAGDFEAVNETPIFHINVREFEELVCNFGKVQQDLHSHAQRFLDYLNEANEVNYSDLLSTDMVMEEAYNAARYMNEEIPTESTLQHTLKIATTIDMESFSVGRRTTIETNDDNNSVKFMEDPCFDFQSEGLTTQQHVRVGV